MQLITFAHKPEAQAFFEAFAFQSTPLSGLYQAEFGWLLITGEGIHEAMASVAMVLGKFSEINRVINFGVAGSLTNQLELHHVYSVRTVYAFEESIQFKSFSLNGDIDLVTSSQRVLTSERRTPLLAMGSMVDRELWGVCFAAKMRNIPVESYKYISDEAGELAACEVVKDLAQRASLALLEVYKKLPCRVGSTEDIQLPGFYFTFSQSHQFKALLQKLAIKEMKPEQQVLESFKVQDLTREDISPKERTKKLLLLMKQSLDPWGSDFEEKNTRMFSSLKHSQVTSPSHYQTPQIKISFHSTTQEELEETLQELQAFDWKTFYHQFKVNDV